MRRAWFADMFSVCLGTGNGAIVAHVPDSIGTILVLGPTRVAMIHPMERHAPTSVAIHE